MPVAIDTAELLGPVTCNTDNFLHLMKQFIDMYVLRYNILGRGILH
jgi:hypothetical protein